MAMQLVEMMHNGMGGHYPYKVWLVPGLSAAAEIVKSLQYGDYVFENWVWDKDTGDLISVEVIDSWEMPQMFTFHTVK